MHQPGLLHISDGGSEHNGEDSDRKELQRRQTQDASSGRAQSLEQRHGIEVAADVTPRGHRHRRGAKQYRHETGEAQEASRAIDRAFDLRAGIGDVTQPLTRALVRLQPVFEERDVLGSTGEESGIGGAAAGLDELRPRQIGGIHEEIRHEAGERAPLVRPRDQNSPDPQVRRADAQPGAHVSAQGGEEPGVRPDFPWRRYLARRPALGERLIGHRHRAT